MINNPLTRLSFMDRIYLLGISVASVALTSAFAYVEFSMMRSDVPLVLLVGALISAIHGFIFFAMCIVAWRNSVDAFRLTAGKEAKYITPARMAEIDDAPAPEIGLPFLLMIYGTPVFPVCVRLAMEVRRRHEAAQTEECLDDSSDLQEMRYVMSTVIRIPGRMLAAVA